MTGRNFSTLKPPKCAELDRWGIGQSGSANSYWPPRNLRKTEGGCNFAYPPAVRGLSKIKKHLLTHLQLTSKCLRSARYVPTDGDCALHAVIDQLQQQGDSEFTVASLRKSAVHHLRNHPVDNEFFVLKEYANSNNYIRPICQIYLVLGAMRLWCVACRK